MGKRERDRFKAQSIIKSMSAEGRRSSQIKHEHAQSEHEDVSCREIVAKLNVCHSDD